jgi:hypothetical protein
LNYALCGLLWLASSSEHHVFKVSLCCRKYPESILIIAKQHSSYRCITFICVFTSDGQCLHPHTYFLANMNNAATNISEHVFARAHSLIPLGYKLRSRITRSRGTVCLIFLGLPDSFQSGCVWRLPFFHIPPKPCLFDYTYSSGSEVASWYSFDIISWRLIISTILCACCLFVYLQRNVYSNPFLMFYSSFWVTGVIHIFTV